jgi:8-oxo-dGTP diphosphatase
MAVQGYVVVRCSAIVMRRDSVLLLHRTNAPTDDWVLPGGNPRPGESLAACAHREVREETGLHVDVFRVALVLETVEPGTGNIMVDIVFAAAESFIPDRPQAPESGLNPQFVPVARLGEYRLRPAIAEQLRAFVARGPDQTAVYLSRLWQPDGPALASRRAEPDRGGQARPDAR